VLYYNFIALVTHSENFSCGERLKEMKNNKKVCTEHMHKPFMTPCAIEACA